MKCKPYTLILVTNKANSPIKEYLDFVSICIKAGVTSVQLREKNLPYKELFTFGKALKELLTTMHIPLIVNDNLDLCLELNADGMHLGQTDGNIKQTRALLGPSKMIGLSVNTLTQVSLANNLPIDYVGLGAIFPTHNKFDVERIWGIAGLKQAASISTHPVVAIGGINESNTHLVMHAGAQGIAAIGSFHNALVPHITTQNLRSIIERGLVYDRSN